MYTHMILYFHCIEKLTLACKLLSFRLDFLEGTLLDSTLRQFAFSRVLVKVKIPEVGISIYLLNFVVAAPLQNCSDFP